MMYKDYAFELAGLGIGVGLSYAFYTCVKSIQEYIKVIKETPELRIDGELVQQLTRSGELVGCIWGAVQAEESLIHSVQRPEVAGVVWKQTIKNQFIAQYMGCWISEEKVIEESTRTVPFFLTNNNIPIQVELPTQLDHIDLEVVSEKFEAASTSLLDNLIVLMKGIRPTGIQYTEEMLLQGTRVLGIGKLISDRGKMILKPLPPLPLIITASGKESVVEKFTSSQTLPQFLGIVSACCSVYFLYRIFRKFWKSWDDFKQRRAIERVIQDAKKRRETQGNDLPESLMCVVCCELRDVVLIPCKHVCVCSDCSLRLDPKICPVCRCKIQSVEPVFYS